MFDSFQEFADMNWQESILLYDSLSSPRMSKESSKFNQMLEFPLFPKEAAFPLPAPAHRVPTQLWIELSPTLRNPNPNYFSTTPSLILQSQELGGFHTL